jgi:stringent starvation protein B
VDNQAIQTLVPVMPEKSLDTVPLRVEVTAEFKARLKGYSARMGVPMGEVLEKLADEPLKELETEVLEKSRSKKTKTAT